MYFNSIITKLLIIVTVVKISADIDISGQVINIDGTPLPEAIVELVGQELKDTTDQSGDFNIIDIVTPIVNASREQNICGKIKIAKQIDRIKINSSDGISILKVEVFTLSGRSVGKITSSHGKNNINIIF